MFHIDRAAGGPADQRRSSGRRWVTSAELPTWQAAFEYPTGPYDVFLFLVQHVKKIKTFSF
jgi:hypothetical protein